MNRLMMALGVDVDVAVAGPGDGADSRPREPLTLVEVSVAGPSPPTAAPVDGPAGQEGASPAALPEVMTPDELAAFLRLNRKTVYELLARRAIPGSRRIGRRYRIARDAVLDWLRGQDRGPGARRDR